MVIVQLELPVKVDGSFCKCFLEQAGFEVIHYYYRPAGGAGDEAWDTCPGSAMMSDWVLFASIHSV